MVYYLAGTSQGWAVDALSKGVGLKADYLGEIFHALRFRIEYDKFVEERQHLIDTKDFRDVRAILKLSAGFLKLLFPDLSTVTEVEFETYCLLPAIHLRQRLREQLFYMDPEFSKHEITLRRGPASTMNHEPVSVEDGAEDLNQVEV